MHLSVNIECYENIFKNGAIIYWKIRNPNDENTNQRVFPSFYFDLIIPTKGAIYVDGCWLSGPFVSPILKENKDIIFESGAEVEGFRFNPLYFSLLTSVQPINLIQSFNLLENQISKKSGDKLIEELRSLKDSLNQSNNSMTSPVRFDTRLQEHSISLEKLRKAVYLLLSQNLSINDIANRLEVSTRWIQKLFKRFFNIAPCELAQLNRFNDSLQLIMTEKPNSSTNITYSSHFYDQSHFIRSFKQFAGLLPSQFVKENHDFYRWMNSSSNQL